MPDPVLRHDEGAIARLTLNTPGNYNALSTQMIESLRGHLDRIGTDDSVRVVIIDAAGKAFCAGHDLRQMQQARHDQDGGARALRTLFADCAALMQRLAALPQPVIAQVQGIATAAGCQLVASCDLAVAADTARFGVNGVNIGLFCSTPMVALTRAVPPKAAFEMLTTGEFIGADRACALGLVNRAVPPEDLAASTLEMAEAIAAKLPSAVRMGKAAFYAQLGLPLDAAYDSASATMCANVMAPDTAEGMAAFLDKRPPAWH